ncbi:hypothetical protein A9762_04130 [Pandoraea sp. ISTKB]|nr:hypothetical protein A9762_04130 [Pandoraea sp. ISTKB]
MIAAVAACAVVYLNPAYKTEVMATQSVSPKTWTLADGTHLSLDASSQVTVQWHVRSRELRLERGAAAMDVGQTWRPFSVAVGDVRIHDIGTLFSVRRTDGGTQIVVQHGEVKVVVASQSASLLANQGLVVQDDRLGPVEPVDASAQMAWKDGRLVFDGVSLAEAIAQMQRYQSHRIVIKDSAAARLRLSGQYNIDGLDDMLRALPSVLPVSVTRQMDGSYVIATRR